MARSIAITTICTALSFLISGTAIANPQTPIKDIRIIDVVLYVPGTPLDALQKSFPCPDDRVGQSKLDVKLDQKMERIAGAWITVTDNIPDLPKFQAITVTHEKDQVKLGCKSSSKLQGKLGVQVHILVVPSR